MMDMVSIMVAENTTVEEKDTMAAAEVVVDIIVNVYKA
jgi:hypothetical protein